MSDTRASVVFTITGAQLMEVFYASPGGSTLEWFAIKLAQRLAVERDVRFNTDEFGEQVFEMNTEWENIVAHLYDYATSLGMDLRLLAKT